MEKQTQHIQKKKTFTEYKFMISAFVFKSISFNWQKYKHCGFFVIGNSTDFLYICNFVL